MPLEQFLTGSSLPWLRPEDQNGAEITRGANLASSFMENSMRQQEMQQKAQMNPIAMKLAHDEEAVKRQQIATGVFMSDERRKTSEAEARSAAWMSQNSDLPYPEFLNKFNKELVGDPTVGDKALNPFTNQMLQDKQNTWKLQNDISAKLEALGIKQDLGTAKNQIDLLKAENAYLRTGREKESPGTIAANEILQTQKDLATAKAVGDPSKIAELEQKLELQKDAYPARQNEEISMGMDDQGRPIFKMTKGGKSVGPTVSTESKTQQSLIATQKNVELLDELKKTIRPEDVGIHGVVGETLVDRLAAQFAPEVANLDRTDNRTKLKAVIGGMARQINMDSQRFSAEDRKLALDTMASAGAMESYPRAIQAIETLQNIMRNRAQVDAKAGGLALPDSLLTADGIKEKLKAGKLTQQQAIDLLKKYHPNLRTK